MKKLALVCLAALSLIALSGCSLFAPEDQEFSGSGITITLNDTFYETDTVQWSLYVSSLKHVFMGLRETKADAISAGIYDLEAYTDLVLDNGGYADATVYVSENGEYMYAYYSATVDDKEYGYMLICMEGENHYYLMNFGCLYDDLEDNKDQYIEWADTIIVE